MGTAFLIIDMQRVERTWKDPDLLVWPPLTKTVIALSSAFEAHKGTVIHVGSMMRVPEIIGEFCEVESILNNHGTSFRKGPYAFTLPVSDHAYAAIKNGFSGMTKAIRAFLELRGIDTVVIGGVCENHPQNISSCVAATAVDFGNSGKFRTIIADGATDMRGQRSEFWVAAYAEHNVEILPPSAIIEIIKSPAVSGNAPAPRTTPHQRRNLAVPKLAGQAAPSPP